MKTIFKTMTFGFALLTMGSATMLTSCKKSDSTASSNVSADDAADAVSSGTSSSTNGMSAEVQAVSTYNTEREVYTTSSALPCGSAFDTTFVRSASTTAGSYNYTINWQYLLTCAGSSVPASLAFSHNMHGTYDFTRISSNDSASSNWTITGLEPTSANVTINGTYMRNGSEQSKVRNMASFTSVITYTLNNVSVSKSTEQINGGSATVNITGAGSGGSTYSYNGTITFGTTGTAILVLNGNTYSITL